MTSKTPTLDSDIALFRDGLLSDFDTVILFSYLIKKEIIPQDLRDEAQRLIDGEFLSPTGDILNYPD